MHAHVNIWKLNDKGAQADDDAARDLANGLRQQPGFHSYTLVRTGDQEVVVVTIFETADQLHAAMHAVADVVHRDIDPVVEGEPMRRAGEVLFHAHKEAS